VRVTADGKEITSVDYAFTEYFETKVLAKRPYLTKTICIRVVEDPVRKEMQVDGERIRFWAAVAELGGRYLRVVTLADERTIHNAFPDRGYKP
jgi:hypothetical protein